MNHACNTLSQSKKGSIFHDKIVRSELSSFSRAYYKLINPNKKLTEENSRSEY